LTRWRWPLWPSTSGASAQPLAQRGRYAYARKSEAVNGPRGRYFPCVDGEVTDTDALTAQNEPVFRAGFQCVHCGRDGFDLYMVHDEVWRAVGMSSIGFLHLPCLEVLLGRQLTLADFTEARVNETVRWAWLAGRQWSRSR
jgi:hypothetical protein